MNNMTRYHPMRNVEIANILTHRGQGQVPECADNLDCQQLQQTRGEIVDLERALAISQLQLASAERQIDSLLRSRNKLKEQLLDSETNYKHALHCAHHDELTGLPNRILLLDRMKQAMAQADRQQKSVALLFIDLDDFKSVNDQLGHAAGDQLLREVGARLSACLRYGDTACRYGGDEFLILLGDIDSDQSLAAVIEKIQSCLAEACLLEGVCVAITASIGAAIYRRDGQTCLDLLKQADHAMYRAKRMKTR